MEVAYILGLAIRIIAEETSVRRSNKRREVLMKESRHVEVKEDGSMI